MNFLRAALTGLAVLILVASPVRAAVETHEPSGLRIVSSNEWLQAYDPAAGTVVWSWRLRDTENVTMVPVVPQAWVLVRQEIDAFDPATGKELWERQLEGDLTWGPQAVGEPALLVYGVRAAGESKLIALSPDDGKQAWSTSFPQGIVGVELLEGEILVHLRSLPPAPEDTGYRRPTGAAVPPPAPETRLALVDGATGAVRWNVLPAADVHGGPFPVGDHIVYESDAGLLVALAKATGAETWRSQQGGPLSAPPALMPGAEDRIQVQQASTFGLLDAATGRRVWETTLPGELALPVSVSGGRVLLAAAQEEPPSTTLMELDPTTGAILSRTVVPGTASHILEEGGRLYVFTTSATTEPSLDRHGRVIRDKEGEVSRATVEGYTLYAIDAGGARKLAEGARDTLMGAPAFAGDLLLYMTRAVPEQAEGQRRAESVKYPQEPLVLHALDPVAGAERWAWKTRGHEDRLQEGWTFLDGTLFVTVGGDNVVTGASRTQLLALDPVTGIPKWRSPWLSGSGVAPEARPDGGLFVLTDLDVAYVLDPATGAVQARRNLVPVYNWIKTNNLIGVILLTGAIATFIFAARRRDLFIRRIAGLSALDEAVGRSTEMGKPVLYVPGLADVDDIQTLASLSILGHVARRTAEYDTPILVPNCRSVVMSMAQEVVKEAYTAVGRPDAFNRDNVRYLSDEQFGFVAGVNGMQMRDRPAANFYMGTFFAESLLLAETGNATGAIQIAGTASASQLPFFVAACDYTLIGEELYAASAYLSKDPLQVGSLKGQDAAKAVLMASILIGTVLFTLGLTVVKELFATS